MDEIPVSFCRTALSFELEGSDGSGLRPVELDDVVEPFDFGAVETAAVTPWL